MTRRGVHEVARAGYGAASEAYASARPSFPGDAVDWLLAGLGIRAGDEVVEIGAGTGKFSALLVERGVAVIAVEPVAAMRVRLEDLGGSIRPVDATAEQMPFEDGSVAALIASQSLHWADVELALTEFDRVLLPEGRVGLVWNFRDTSVPWQADLDALLTRLRGDAPHSRDGRWEQALVSSVFQCAAKRSWTWSVRTDAAGVVQRVRSVSYVAALTEREQETVDGEVRDILSAHGLDEDAIAFPYVTEAFLLRRR